MSMHTKIKLVFITSTLLILAACGGGSASTSATGVAAVGAPISSGVLSAIDASGRTATTTIADDGSYSINFLSSLQPPVLLKAEGVSGGRTVVHFGAITSSSEKTINVTPVSTAVVAQVMQADPGAVFASADTAKIALLTTSQVSATNTVIGNALASARTAAGISGSGALDFLNTPFSADKTGLDKLLDLVRVSVQPDRSIQLKNKTADGVTTVSSSGVVSGALGTVESIDTAGIDELGKAIEATFRDASAWQTASQSVLNLFSSSFIHGGETRLTVIASIAQDAADMQGARFLPAKVLNCKTTGAFPVCEALFTVKYTDGSFEPFIFPVSFESGSWKIYGNQAPVTTNYGAVVYRTISGNNAAITRSGFNLEIFDNATIGNTLVGYVKVWFGAASGSPEFVMVNPAKGGGVCGGNEGYLEILPNTNDETTCVGNFAELSNARIDQLRSSFATTRPKITIRYYDTLGNWISNTEHVISVESLPLKTTEVTDGYFATVTNTSWSDFVSANLNSEFTLAISKGAAVGLEDVVGARPLATTLSTQRLPYTTVRTGSSWRVLKANSSLLTVTRDTEGRMYWYQRQP